MNETKYLVDNNALIELRRERRASEFFHAHCHLPADVLYEAQGFPDLTSLKTLIYEVTPKVVEHVRTVMKSIRVGDTNLVDLYRNKGAADPVLIASALDAAEQDDGVLFPDRWVIITRDKAVIETAQEFGIETASPAQLAALIDAMGA
jgi:hypothetical protein